MLVFLLVVYIVSHQFNKILDHEISEMYSREQLPQFLRQYTLRSLPLQVCNLTRVNRVHLKTEIELISALFPHGCLVLFPNREFWIDYVVLLFDETRKYWSTNDYSQADVTVSACHPRPSEGICVQ